MQPIGHKWRLIVLSALGLVLFFWLNNAASMGETEESAFEAAQTIEKSEAQSAALAFAEAHLGAGAWQAFALYDADAQASGYITKEKLSDEYEKTWAAHAPLEYWRVEAENASQAYHILVKLDEPKVFGFEFTGSPQDAVQADLPTDFEALLREMGYDLAQFEFDGASSAEGIRFTHNQHIGEASLRLEVRLSEDRVTALMPVVQPPAAFSEWKDAQDAKGALTSLLSMLLWFGLAIAAIVYMAVYRAQMSFSRGVWLTLAFLFPYLLYTVNMYPGVKLTTASSAGAAMFGIQFQQFMNMLLAASVYVCLVAGEGLWRKSGFDLWPHHRERRFREVVMRGVGLGYLYCFIIVGVQAVIFYIGGKLFDVWFGVDPMLSSYNLVWPSTYPLLAWSAAISEEAVFRSFAIIFFAMIFRPIWRWVARLSGKPIFLHPMLYLLPAVTVASLIWALAHTSYSVYPVYTRLVEVAILGFVFSYLFLKYGLIAAIFAHATVDLMLMGMEIVINDPSHIAVGIFYILMPLIVGLLIRFLVPPRKQKPPASTADGSSPAPL